MIWLICAFLALSIILVLSVGYLELDELPEEDREYKDPLPTSLRLIWPSVRWISRVIVPLFPAGFRKSFERRLQVSGLFHLFDVEQFIGMKLVIALLFMSGTAMGLLMLGQLNMVYLMFAGILGFFIPDLRLNEIRQAYTRKIVRELPTLLDFLTLGVESGQNLTGAIRLTLAKAPPGALRVEFAKVIRDISAGMPRGDALYQMQERLDIIEVTAMVSAMIQAERVGAPLAPILRDQAAQRRTERFLLAEKKAFEAPVKMLGPLVIFIFPCTFAFLGYFLYQKIMASGAF
jgi:tight adherence protein C